MQLNPSCDTCGHPRAHGKNESGLFTVCETKDCKSVDMRFYHSVTSPTDSDKPAQAVKGKTGAETIALRESVYGPFAVHAKAEQEMKQAMTSQPGWAKLNDVQKSAAEMIVHKLARILNSSADYADNWHDIAGYATLVEQDLDSKTKPDGG